jgi:hypothetical protein
MDEKGALAAAPAAAAPLPRLRSNNSIGIPAEDGPDVPRKEPAIPVSKSAYKTEHCVKENIRIAAETYGLETLAFFTLTFAKPTFSAKCAQQRMNSLLTNIVRKRYGNRYLGVLERHESGAIHFHFVIHVGRDIRSGFNWTLAHAAYEAAKRRQFHKARQLWVAAAGSSENGAFLRGEWAFWRGARERYRWLGRCEIVPIRSTGEAVARYTGGYIAKHMQHRRKEDKGVRLVRTGTPGSEQVRVGQSVPLALAARRPQRILLFRVRDSLLLRQPFDLRSPPRKFVDDTARDALQFPALPGAFDAVSTA